MTGTPSNFLLITTSTKSCCHVVLFLDTFSPFQTSRIVNDSQIIHQTPVTVQHFLPSLLPRFRQHQLRHQTQEVTASSRLTALHASVVLRRHDLPTCTYVTACYERLALS